MNGLLLVTGHGAAMRSCKVAPVAFNVLHFQVNGIDVFLCAYVCPVNILYVQGQVGLDRGRKLTSFALEGRLGLWGTLSLFFSSGGGLQVFGICLRGFKKETGRQSSWVMLSTHSFFISSSSLKSVSTMLISGAHDVNFSAPTSPFTL
jgi:hypothetical protein